MLTPLNGKYLTEEDAITYDTFLHNLYGEGEDLVKNVSFVVTEDCPLACTYCYEKHKSNKKMSFDVAKRGIDLLFDKEKLNGYYNPDNVKAFIIDFIGGEPLVAIDVIDYATEYFKYKSHKIGHPSFDNYKISISSNGVLYDTPEVQSYIKRNIDKLSLNISVDGNKELHDKCRLFKDGRGSYDLASHALKDISKYNDYATTKMTLCPENVTHTFEAIKSLYEDIGLQIVNANCVFEKGWTTEHSEILYSELVKLSDWIIDNKLYDKFYCSFFSTKLGTQTDEKSMEQNWCGGAGKMLAVGVNGDCYPCLRYIPMALNNRPPIIIGNVNDGLLSTQSESDICKHLCGISLKSQSPQKCIDCKVSQGCGLCSAFNYDEFGDANIRATYICEMHKARVKANEYFWNKLKTVVK